MKFTLKKEHFSSNYMRHIGCEHPAWGGVLPLKYDNSSSNYMATGQLFVNLPYFSFWPHPKIEEPSKSKDFSVYLLASLAPAGGPGACSGASVETEKSLERAPCTLPILHPHMYILFG